MTTVKDSTKEDAAVKEAVVGDTVVENDNPINTSSTINNSNKQIYINKKQTQNNKNKIGRVWGAGGLLTRGRWYLPIQ